MTENRIWYVNSNRKTYGPYTKDDVIKMLKSGKLKHSDYIFKEGYSDWDYIYNIPEFDRRLIMPDSGQPLVEVPKDAIPEQDVSDEQEGQDLWYVHDGENQKGPYNTSYIKQALNDKTIFWTYYVWREGFDNWVQIKECKEFDRRRNPRNLTPINVGITTNLEEIQKQAVPSIEQNKELYGDVVQPATYQYGLTKEDQEELRGRYPVKAIVFLILMAVVLFGAVRMYPKFLHSSRIKAKENKAESMYAKAQDLVRLNKMEEAYNIMFDVMDMYPDTKAYKKVENDLIKNEPVVKAQIADETRRIRTLIESYSKKYAVMPNNAVDINYVPPFYLKYFSNTYFKRNNDGGISVMSKGNRIPVQNYMFVTEAPGKELEQDNVKPELFAIDVQSYIILSYVGQRTVVKPIDIPQIIKKELSSPAKEVRPATNRRANIISPRRVTKPKVVEQEQEDGLIDEQQEEELPTEQPLEGEYEGVQEEPNYDDQYVDEINEIRKDN